MVQTKAIVVQVGQSGNERKWGAFWEDSCLGMPMWKRFMKTV